MSNFLASVFGGGSVQAPVMPTLNAGAIQGQYLGQNFSAAQNISNQQTQQTSQTNLNQNLAGLNQVNPGALQGLNQEASLGQGLLSDSASGLPAWAQTYLNNAQRQGDESAVGRGVGAFSGNGQSGVNQFLGNNAMNLVNQGANLTNSAFGQEQNLVNANMYRADPNSSLLTPGQFLQAGELNTGILGQNAVAQATATNFNNNNSPLGNLTRTGLSMLSSLAGSFLGDSSLGSSLSTSGNGGSGPIGGSYGGGGGVGGGGGGGGLMGGLGLLALA